jgi:hypothetical protein
MPVYSGILVRTETNDKERMITGSDSVEGLASYRDERYSYCLDYFRYNLYARLIKAFEIVINTRLYRITRLGKSVRFLPFSGKKILFFDFNVLVRRTMVEYGLG